MTPERWIQLLAALRNGEDVDNAVAASDAIEAEATKGQINELYILLEDDDFFVREAAAAALVRLEGSRALPGLLKALEMGAIEDGDNDLLSAIVVRLLEAAPNECALELIDLLTDDRPSRRRNAAWGLGFARIPGGLPALQTALGNEKDADVRAALVGSIASYRSDADVVHSLIGSLADPAETVRIAAIAALGYIKDERAQTALRRHSRGVCSATERYYLEEALKL